MLMTLDSEGDAEKTRHVHLSMLPVGRQTAEHRCSQSALCDLCFLIEPLLLYTNIICGLSV